MATNSSQAFAHIFPFQRIFKIRFFKVMLRGMFKNPSSLPIHLHTPSPQTIYYYPYDHILIPHPLTLSSNNVEIHIYPKEKMLAMIRATIVDQEKFRWLPPSLITDFHQGRHRMFACREKITSYYLSAPSVATNYELKNYELKNKDGWEESQRRLTWQIFHCSREIPRPLLCSFSHSHKTFQKRKRKKRSVFMK